MKNLIVLLFSIVPATCLVSQNYVPNPSFEILTGCPNCNTPNGLYDEFRLAAPPWRSYRGSIDLFDPCGNWCTDIPNNYLGNQFPHSGLRHAGFDYFTLDTFGRYEYLGVPLVAQLAVGQEYHVEFWVSKAEIADRASNKVGVIFLTKGYDARDSAYYMPNRAHICSDSIITDEIGWTKIEGNFVADSAYTHMAIGYMFTNSQYIDGLGDTLLHPKACYYYIDDVCVIPVGGDCSLPLSAFQPQESAVLGIFPNPIVKSQSTLLHFSKESSVEVYDIMGQLVRHFENVVEIDVTDWPAGVYILKEMNGAVVKIIVME